MSERARAMAARLSETARRLGVEDEGRELLVAAFRLAMTPRAELVDEQHPDFLHPARTALILMDDAGIADPVTLAAATLAETRRPDLRAAGEDVKTLDPRVAGLLEELPTGRAADTSGNQALGSPGEADPYRLREDLVVADAAVLLIALAERLDHARHLHLRPREEWVGYHAVTCAAHAHVAPRSDPRLAHRLNWWCRTFRERFLDDPLQAP